MKRASYRDAGVASSVYDVSSDEECDECEEPEPPSFSLPNSDTKPVPPKEDQTEDQTTNIHTTAPSKIFYANFKPSCVAMEAITQHLKVVLGGTNMAIVDTLCSNILCETANRLKNRMRCATNNVFRSMCLEAVVSYTTHKDEITSEVVDAMTLEAISGVVFVMKLTYTNGTTTPFFFQKERAMRTMLSWVRVFRFDAEILELGKTFDDIQEHTIRSICFDFIQCVRQALFTLGISVGSTKREQMYVTGVTNMDTLVYYVSLADHRIHQGALGKHSLIVYPDRPKVKRKYSEQL